MECVCEWGKGVTFTLYVSWKYIWFSHILEIHNLQKLFILFSFLYPTSKSYTYLTYLHPQEVLKIVTYFHFHYPLESLALKIQ